MHTVKIMWHLSKMPEVIILNVLFVVQPREVRYCERIINTFQVY